MSQLLSKYGALLDRAQFNADVTSTCAKVQVGSLILNEDFVSILGSNHGIERNCRRTLCNRIEKYGEDSKSHRLPSDCVSIHSEVDAICKAARDGISLKNAVIFVTRYPCEACARAIAESGIRKVVYGRKEKMSDMAEKTLSTFNVEVIHVEDWEYKDNNS